MTLIFDIETGPLPEPELAQFLPAFDPAQVKVGNLKDPEKIQAKQREAEAKHRGKTREEAALDALTGCVLAIGIRKIRDEGTIDEMCGNEGGQAGEVNLLRHFWELVRAPEDRIHRLIGFNVIPFDLPFLVKRSWKLRVPVPTPLRQGRYWSPNVIDLRDVWQMGDRQATGSLDVIARHLGVGRKNGDGAQFAALWWSDRPAALKYLRQDVELTAAVARVLVPEWCGETRNAEGGTRNQ